MGRFHGHQQARKFPIPADGPDPRPAQLRHFQDPSDGLSLGIRERPQVQTPQPQPFDTLGGSQINTPLQWSTSCWMIWAVQPEKVFSRTCMAVFW